MLEILKNKKVGYYCPFTYPFLNYVDVESHFYIKEDEKAQTFLGTTKLCKKSTAILRSLEEAAIDCILLVECCNISSAVYSFIQTFYPEVTLIKIEISKNKNLCVKNILKGFDVFKQYIKENPYQLYKCYQENVNSKSQNSIWCNYPIELIKNYDRLALEEKLLFLFQNVKCPLISLEQTIDVTLAEDEGCLHRAYINSKKFS